MFTSCLHVLLYDTRLKPLRTRTDADALIVCLGGGGFLFVCLSVCFLCLFVLVSFCLLLLLHCGFCLLFDVCLLLLLIADI